MVETRKTLAELEVLNEAELETIIAAKGADADDAKYSLGKLMIEGTNPDAVARNDRKGINWVKEAADNDHFLALEFKTYYDIRFEKYPDI